MFYYEPIKLTIPLDFLNIFYAEFAIYWILSAFPFPCFFKIFFRHLHTQFQHDVISSCEEFMAANCWHFSVLSCHNPLGLPQRRQRELSFAIFVDSRARVLARNRYQSDGPADKSFWRGNNWERERKKKPSQRRRHIGRRRQGQPGCRGR